MEDGLAQQLGEMIGRVLPGPVAVDTAEGQVLTACIEGMVHGTTRVGDVGPTQLTNPGAIDMLAREAEKLEQTN